MESTEASAPLFRKSGAVATIEFNRPRVRNRIESDDISELMDIFNRVNQDQEIRVLILRGKGKIISAGYDLSDLTRRAAGSASETTDDTPHQARIDFSELTLALENLRVPTICRIPTGVYGGATDLALSCDFRVGTEKSEMFMPAARLGLHYYTAGLIRWSSRLGVNAAKYLFLTANRISADEMLRVGYLTHRVDSDELDEQVEKLALRLASMSPTAIQGMKSILNQIAGDDLDMAQADRLHRQSLGSDDMKEGLAAWNEKRSAVFK